MFFPLVKSNHFNDLLEDKLQRLINIVDRALDNLLIVLGKYLVFLKNHRSCP